MNKVAAVKALDFVLLAFAVVYFAGFLSFYPDAVFLKEAPYHIPHEYEMYFEYVLWTFFGLLILDLYLKYKKLNDWKKFLKKALA